MESMQFTRASIVLAVCAVVLAACGGTSEPAPLSGPGTPGATVAAPQQTQVVLSYDRNGDDLLDLVTVDAATEEFRIVAVLDGSPSGQTVDMTASLAGTALDPAIATALRIHLADSLEVASETRLDVLDGNGNPIPVTVFE
jgi:hypothetical protein